METTNTRLQNNVYFILTKSILIFLYVIILIALSSYSLSLNSIQYIHNICPHTYLWYYVLVSSILLVHNLFNNISYYNIFVGLYLLMVGWGIYEFGVVNCIYDLNSTLVYKMTIVHFITNIYYVLYQFINIIYKYIKPICQSNIELSDLLQV